MKFALLLSLVTLASGISDSFAQRDTRPGNGNGGGMNRPGPRPSPRPNPDYRPGPGPSPRPNPDYRPGPGPSPRPNPDYRPGPGPSPRPNPDYRPGPGPGYRPAPHRPVYTPSRPTTYRPVYRVPERVNYGTPYYHRPPMYRPVSYSRVYHSPWTSVHSSSVRYHRTYDYYMFVRRSYPSYVYLNWIYWPMTGYSNGYYVFDSYPYYVFNGYRYRYSNVDRCNYQLVDSYTHRVETTYWEQSCNVGYDQCAFERDRLNERAYDYRYFCAETHREQSYSNTRPTYEYSYSDFGYYDSYTPDSTWDNRYDSGYDDYGRDCYDYDYANDVCYDY